ncbi:MAG TPA: TetR/AcrR family transcriptional regulator [Gaiellaceae bacterium]|nr:TetR/AcrR family transcriptional regulator [Gaiellaceae bacterium]
MRELSPRGREIVRAAQELLEREGPEALTMRRLADGIGIRAPSLYKHLSGKAELEERVIAAGLDDLGESLARAAAGDDGLRDVAAAYRRFALDRPHLYRLLASRRQQDTFELQAASPLLKAVGSVRRARAAWAFLHGMVELELSGRFPDGADVDAAWDAGVEAFTR